MSTELAPVQITPMEMLMSAVQQGAGIDVIERLAKLQREMLDYGARIDWEKAMTSVQQKIGHVRSDATNPQTSSKYATFAQLDGALRPHYSAEGFNLSFDTVDCPVPAHNRVVCYVSRGGYTRRYQIDMAITTEGFKGKAMMTETHAEGASISYGCRYLEKMIFNIAVGEIDRDGNKPAAPSGPLTDEFVKERVKLIEEAPDLLELEKLYKEGYKIATAAKDADAIKKFTAAKDKKRRLGGLVIHRCSLRLGGRNEDMSLLPGRQHLVSQPLWLHDRIPRIRHSRRTADPRSEQGRRAGRANQLPLGTSFRTLDTRYRRSLRFVADEGRPRAGT